MIRFRNSFRGLACALALAAAVACAPTQERVDLAGEPEQPPVEEVQPEAPALEPPAIVLDPPELEAPDPADAPVPVALLLPLSGERGGLGEALLQAAQMALFDVADDRFELIVRDTEGTPEGAAAAAESALDDGARLVLGPIFSASVEAVTPIARASGVPVLAFSNNRAVAGDGTYVLGLLPGAQVERILGYAASQGHRDFAVLAPDDAFGDLVVQAMHEAAPRFGVQVTRSETYDPQADDVSGPVRRLTEYDRRQRQTAQAGSNAGDAETAPPPFDAVLIPVGGSRLQAIAPHFPFHDIGPDEVQFLGTAEWNDPGLGREPALVGGWFPAPPPDAWEAFAGRYRETFAAAPPRLAALAYDGTALAALLSRQEMAGDSGESPFSETRLTQRDGFAGVGGIFRLNRDGTAERRYAIMEIHRDGLEQRDPAPASFRPLVN